MNLQQFTDLTEELRQMRNSPMTQAIHEEINRFKNIHNPAAQLKAKTISQAMSQVPLTDRDKIFDAQRTEKCFKVQEALALKRTLFGNRLKNAETKTERGKTVIVEHNAADSFKKLKQRYRDICNEANKGTKNINYELNPLPRPGSRS